MKSQEQNDLWRRLVEWAPEDDLGPLANEIGMSFELAEWVWQYENAYIECYRAKLLGAIDTPEVLREYLGFEEMDDGLWTTFAHLIYSLVSRRDISNLDIVINRITEFVQMCPQFYRLRYGKVIYTGGPIGGPARTESGHEDEEAETTIH